VLKRTIVAAAEEEKLRAGGDVYGERIPLEYGESSKV
jgi:hypothetical protein